MQVDQLIRMANQIGDFFGAMPDRDEARENLAQHLRKFWDPRMRQTFLAHIDAAGTGELNGITAEAVQRHRALLG